MATGTVLEREEYIEQAYFFRVLRERIGSGNATQDVLDRVHEEVLSTTHLPYAIQFLAAEVRHSGMLSSGFTRLSHYFTPFQAFVIRGTEEEARRLSVDTALLVLEREATYRADKPTPAGLFVYQFEVLCRNRLGYDTGLSSMAGDPFYVPAWKEFLDLTRQQLGVVELDTLIHLRSDWHTVEMRRIDPNHEPARPALFGEKEGRIAKASQGRDPLYLFAALQRQLNYPEVPRPQAPDDLPARFEALKLRVQQLEARIRLTEAEVKGQIDLAQFGKPDILAELPDNEF